MAGRESEGKHVFLCYSHLDSPAVDWLQHALEADGVSVWRDTKDLLPGQNREEEIRRAITASTLVFVACFSRASVARSSSFQNTELTWAVEERRKHRPDVPWLIPVRLDDCQLPDLALSSTATLESLGPTDLFGERRDRQLGRLITAITRVFASNMTQPEVSDEVQATASRGAEPTLAGVRLGMPDSRAVVIGASSFAAEELLNIPAVLDTVGDLRQALIDRCGIARDRVRFMPDWPDASSVGAALAREAERTEGVLVVYYAGHGLIGRRDELYLAMGQTNPAPGQLEYTGLSYSAVRRSLQDSPARAVLVVLDCCFSNLGNVADLSPMTSIDDGLVLLSAARTEQELAQEGYKYTALTGELLRLLTEGDDDGPRELTIRDAFRYLDTRLADRELPRPHLLSARGADQITLAANPARWPAPQVNAAAASAQDQKVQAELETWSPEVLAAATRNYLFWLTEVNDQIQVTGLARSPGALSVPLEQVYTALRLDQSSQTERAAAAENLWRELERELLARDLSPKEEDDLRWVLYADLPAAEYLELTSLLASLEDDAGKVLHVGEVYQRDGAVIILGDPGSGKTTIMRWLTLVHARALLLDQPEVRVEQVRIDAGAEAGEQFVLGRPLLPIQIRVAEYAADRQQRRQLGQQPRGLREYLRHHSWNQRYPTWSDGVPGHRTGDRIEPGLLAGVLETALREQRALVVLDGLDEVPAEERTAVADAITEFIARWIPHRTGPGQSNKVIVTSRIAGYQLAPLPADLTQVTIEKMTEEALRIFIHNWMRAVLSELAEGADAAALAGDLIELLARPGNRRRSSLTCSRCPARSVTSSPSLRCWSPRPSRRWRRRPPRSSGRSCGSFSSATPR